MSRLLGPALVVSFLPFVALCFCCFPVADDFVLAGHLQEHGLLGTQGFYFREWTGKYSGILTTSLFLQCFGFGAYWLAPLLLIAGTLLVAWLVVRGAVGVRGRPALLAAVVLGAFFLARVRSPNETIYWLSAATEYQGANLATILLLALLMRRPVGRAARLVDLAGIALVALVAVGATETMMFALVLVVATWGVTRVVARRLPTTRQAIVSLAILTGAALMVFAPGTAARGSLFPAAHQLVPSLVSATTRGLLHALEWTLQPALWGISLLFVRAAPALARRLGVAAGGVLPILWLLGLVCAGHFPAYWAMGMKPPGRALANVWIVFLAGWFVLVLPLVARAMRRFGCDLRNPRLATLGRALVVVGLFVPSNVPRALAELGLGGALRHRREQIERAATVAEAKRTGNKDVVLVPLTAKPRTIWVDDVTADPADWRNKSYAAWHGLASVRVAAPAGR